MSYGVGVQAFSRGQARFNPDFDAGDDLHTYEIFSRVRLEGWAGVGPVSVFAQLQDARAWGFEASTASDSANTDMQQGYLQLAGESGDASGWIRIGRQEMNYGTQRMIGALGWLPTGRSFNALRVRGEYQKFGIDLAAAMLSPPGTYEVTDETVEPPSVETRRTRGSAVFAAELSFRLHPAINLHPTIYIDASDGRVEAPHVDREVFSPGGWLYGEPVEGLKYTVEGFGQFGTNGGRTHRAWAAAADVGYWFRRQRIKTGGLLRYSIGSGEACTSAPEDGLGCEAADSTEFFNFYPTNHKFYGVNDLFGWRNMRDAEAQFDLSWDTTLRVRLSYHFFQLHEAAGRWSDVGGANVGVGWDPQNSDNTLGHEIDLIATAMPLGGTGLFASPLMIQPGYGLFIPTGVGAQLGGSDLQHFAYLWIVSTFSALR